MKPPIYKPSGAALEYGDLALNIYTGCNHGCYYCFAPNVLHKTREDFAKVEPRKDIVNEVRKQLDKEKITGKMIHLCFTCDPYPADVDTTPTREIIMLLKAYGNHVQILTKGGYRIKRDADLFDKNDFIGVTYCGYPPEDRMIWRDISMYEPKAAPPHDRLMSAFEMKMLTGATIWVSMEPVLDAKDALDLLECKDQYFDLYRIGKLNYHPSTINWHDFGHAAEEICKRRGLFYYIKDSLRAEMDRT